MQLRDKKILLTGAGGGIGQALARALLAQGVKLVVTGRTRESAARAANLLSGVRTHNVVHSVVAEVLDMQSLQLSQQIKLIAARHVDLDGIIHCAGANGFRAADDLNIGFVTQIINTNLTGVILCTQALLPTLLKRPEALITVVGSTFGSIGYPGFGVYCASKFGVRGYAESLRRELADTAVKVVYVAPRATQTDMNSAAVNAMNETLKVAADSPERVAAGILVAMQTNRAQLYIGWPEKLFVKLNALLTFLVDGALIKQLPIIKRFLQEESSHAA